MRLDSLLLVTLLSLVAAPAQAQTIYKLIDKNGRITYSDTAPKSFNGQVIPLNIDPDANVASSPRAAPEAAVPKSPNATQAGSARSAAVDRLQQAQDAVVAAREEVASGKDPLDDEWQTLVSGAGGGRRVPGEAYFARQQALADKLKRAERDLEDAERNFRRAN